MYFEVTLDQDAVFSVAGRPSCREIFVSQTRVLIWYSEG